MNRVQQRPGIAKVAVSMQMNKMKAAMLHRLALLDSTPLHDSMRSEQAASGRQGASIAVIQKRQTRQVMSRVLRHWAAGIKLLQAGLEKVKDAPDGTATLFRSRRTLPRVTTTKVSFGAAV